MIFELLPQYPYALVVATFLWALFIGLAARFIVFRTSIFDDFIDFPLPPLFVTMLNVMFVFFMAFTASDAYQGYNNARISLNNEKFAITRLINIPVSSPELLQEKTRLLESYLKHVIDIEWKAHFNKERSAAAEQALADLGKVTWHAARNCAEEKGQAGGCADNFALANHVRALDDLRQARETRLSIGMHETHVLRFVLCILLALNAAIGLAALFRKNKKASTMPLIMFCTSLWIIFGIVVMHANPYIGPNALTSSALESLAGK